MTLRSIHDNIIFVFEDEFTNKGEFAPTADTPIVMISSVDDTVKQARWATALYVGPECTIIQPGDRILIPALRWTAGVMYEGQKVWKTDELQLVGYERDSSLVVLNKYVVFSQIEPTRRQTVSNVIVVEYTAPDSPTGKVALVAPDVTGVSVGDTIVYNGITFSDTFKHNGVDLAFIKQADVLAVHT